MSSLYEVLKEQSRANRAFRLGGVEFDQRRPWPHDVSHMVYRTRLDDLTFIEPFGPPWVDQEPEAWAVGDIGFGASVAGVADFG